MSNQPFGFNPSDPDDESASGAGSGAGAGGGSGSGPLPGFPGNFNINDLGAALSQLGAMLSSASANPSGDAPVNWASAEDMARKTLVTAGDPTVAQAEAKAVRDAIRLADLWLDQATALPSTGTGARAWSRSEWLTSTLPAWQRIINPVAEHITGAMTGMLSAGDDLSAQLPEELRALLPQGTDLGAMLGPLMGMAKQMGANVFAMQVGSALAALAGEVVSSGDVGLPLTTDGIPTLIPANVANFAKGLEVAGSEVELYLALREVAHQRLFTHVPWLAPRVIEAVEAYARGIGLDDHRLTDMLSDIDLNDPASLQEALSSGVLVPDDTPEQKAALDRLETMLALVEGWVDHVVTAAVNGRLTNASRLAEAVRRRRAAGGPAEKTFATLVGLELRPRRLREAAALWSELEAERGVAGRDAVWEHPDLLPSASDLSDPHAFVAGSAITDEMLAELAAGPAAESPQPPSEQPATDEAEMPSPTSSPEDETGWTQPDQKPE